MKAYLKSDRKVVVDVDIFGWDPTTYYVNKDTGELYREDEIELKEYYGG